MRHLGIMPDQGDDSEEDDDEEDEGGDDVTQGHSPQGSTDPREGMAFEFRFQGNAGSPEDGSPPDDRPSTEGNPQSPDEDAGPDGDDGPDELESSSSSSSDDEDGAAGSRMEDSSSSSSDDDDDRAASAMQDPGGSLQPSSPSSNSSSSSSSSRSSSAKSSIPEPSPSEAEQETATGSARKSTGKVSRRRHLQDAKPPDRERVLELVLEPGEAPASGTWRGFHIEHVRSAEDQDQAVDNLLASQETSPAPALSRDTDLLDSQPSSSASADHRSTVSLQMFLCNAYCNVWGCDLCL